jgi:predicted O-methyltransferase YrrM
MPDSVREDATLLRILDRLHAASEAQESVNAAQLAADGGRSTRGSEADVEAGRAFWADKFVALDRDKAEFCYLLARARGARRIVEAGTSFGVSTLYLAAAVRDNGGGVVIGTEREPNKVAAARHTFAEAGLDAYIDLREGDLRVTLAPDDGPVDLLLLDIWVPMVRATVELVAPRIPVGGLIIADNTTARRREYAPLFEFLDHPSNGFSTMTLPFSQGLEVAVRTSPTS